MAANSKKESGRRGNRLASQKAPGASRVSGAAGNVGFGSGSGSGSQSSASTRVEQRSSTSSGRQSSGKQATHGRSSASSNSRSRAGRSSTPATPRSPQNAPESTGDARFINWLLKQWGKLEAHQRQSVYSALLLILSLLLFASLTVFHTAFILGSIAKFFLTFFGWAAYPLALGLVVFAVAHLIEGIQNRPLIRWSLVIGLFCILLLLLLESRLILGPMNAGVIAEFLIGFLLGWPPLIQHIILIGLILIVSVITFRITFGHILMVASAIQNMLPGHAADAEDKHEGPSPFLGQRPRYSRYGSGLADEEDESTAPKRQVAQGTRKDIRLGGRAGGLQNGAGDDEGNINFEADFDVGDDSQNDINLHKREIGLVPRGPRAPAQLDLSDHTNAVRDVVQQPLMGGEDAPQPSKRPARKQSVMEPLQPNPHKKGNAATAAGDAHGAVQPDSSWVLPDISLLHNPDNLKLQMLGEDTATLARTIQETLRSFRVDAEVRQEDISIGPTVIRFGIRPTGKPEMTQDDKGRPVPVRDSGGNIVYETRTRVSRIMALQNDLALVLEAKTIRMEAPVPGRPYVGVEIPNKNSRLVTLREVLESKEYQAAKAKSKLAVALGKDVAGSVRVGDLARMPHLLIAGATGAGKCLAYDEPVFLANGSVVKVQDLLGQSAQVIGITDTQTMQQVPVTATFTENGVQEIFEITLDNGVVLRRTGEHPLWAACLDENQHVGRQANRKAVRRTRAINSGWVQTKNLRVSGNRPNFDGHVILCPITLHQQGTVSKSDADVILCAALLAEGGLNSVGSRTNGGNWGTPRFTNADAPIVDLVATAALAYGCQVVVSPHKKKGNIDYYISRIGGGGRGKGSNLVRELVCEWGIHCLATQKRIPAWVFQLPNEQIAMFLRVFIDCDGWFDATNDRTPTVNITSANPVLIRQIGQLALRLGIVGSYIYKNNGYTGAWTWSSRMVAEWQERVGSIVKQEKLSRAVQELARQKELAATEWNAWRRAQPSPQQKFADCPSGYEWRKIVAIHRTTAPTVNIEVHSENHAFVGYAVEHNSVMINTIIASLLFQCTSEDVRLLMVDPKMVELNMYNGIPHLLSPVVTEVEKVVPLLRNAINEMERRYRLFSQLGVRNLDGYRKLRAEKLARGDSSLTNMSAIVIIIDELADLMMAAPEEVEGMICRLAQLARATGIHLVVATQRPSVDVITGLIKANIPTRISFMVSSAVDSRTIIDMGGAERLLGRGDMLYLPADAGRPERIQGAFLADDEVEALVMHWRQQFAEQTAKAMGAPGEHIDPSAPTQALSLSPVEPGWEIKEEPEEGFVLDDELLDLAEEIVRDEGRASISLLQRRLRIGYSRAARLIDLLEEHGIIGPSEQGGRSREVFDNGDSPSSLGDAHSLADEAAEIAEAERERNEFLRKQAERKSSPQ
jgi:DNA polymerase III delta prime subunit